MCNVMYSDFVQSQHFTNSTVHVGSVPADQTPQFIFENITFVHGLLEIQIDTCTHGLQFDMNLKVVSAHNVVGENMCRRTMMCTVRVYTLVPTCIIADDNMCRDQ